MSRLEKSGKKELKELRLRFKSILQVEGEKNIEKHDKMERELHQQVSLLLCE